MQVTVYLIRQLCDKALEWNRHANFYSKKDLARFFVFFFPWNAQPIPLERSLFNWDPTPLLRL